ncbi:polysaccharide biosynthesis/export family protein [Taklimakanibacter deserti]|uniref:polysaccharide biosynthesis/export family protein n=1 Tax=Taklimakanibacter deserti TaxID=2267839 RepID=UPI0013C42072
MFRRSIMALILLVPVLIGCSGGPKLGDPPSGGERISHRDERGPKVLEGSAKTSAEAVFAGTVATAAGKNVVPPPEDYKISPLDVIEISVFQVDELTRTVQVNNNGLVSMPLLGSVQAGGKTTTELASTIGRKLGEKYLESPQVSVFVKEYTSQRVTVDGAVKKPGIFATTGRLSLLQAVALAEGLNDVADPSGILVFRTVDNKRMAARFDLNAIRSGKADDPLLKAGDVVMVDESSSRTTFRDIKSALSIPGLFSLLLL